MPANVPYKKIIYVIITADDLKQTTDLILKNLESFVAVFKLSTQTTQMNWLYDHMNIKHQLIYIDDHQPAQ